ncbi:MAG: sensor histidine kinase [Clostridia bacterium]|nr:sensor histidine kinase [Clostridia bacterium]
MKKKLRMSTCILICMFLLTALCVGLIGGVLILRSDQGLREMAIDNVVYLARSGTTSIDTRIRDITDRCSVFASSFDVYRQLKSAYSDSGGQTHNGRLWAAQRALVPLMTQRFYGLDSLYTVNLVTDDFVFNEEVFKPVGVSTAVFQHSDLYEEAMRSTESVSWIPTYRFADMFGNGHDDVPYTPEYLFSLAMPMRMYCLDTLSNGGFIHISLSNLKKRPLLVLSFEPDFFHQFFNGQRVLQYSDMIITDENGQVVYSNNADLLYQRMPQSWVDNVLRSEDDRGVYTDRGEKYFFCTARIQANGWIATIQMPWDAPAREVRDSLLQRLVTITAALGVLACALTLILQRMLMKPINEMHVAFTRLGEGDFHSPLPEHAYYEFDDMVQAFNAMRDRLYKLIHENYEIKLSERDAELASLNLQINPHFLYNTLNIIDWMIDETAYAQSRQVIRMLSGMLRYTTDTGRSMVTLREDLQWLESYVRIVSIRFSREYEFCVEVPDEVMQIRVPKLFLQPFVENAVLHGFKGRKRGMVRIRAELVGQNATFEVFDDGNGIQPQLLEQLTREPTGDEASSHSIGVMNVYRRLGILYGERFTLNFDSEVGKYTRVTIVIPVETADQGENILES